MANFAGKSLVCLILPNYLHFHVFKMSFKREKIWGFHSNENPESSKITCDFYLFPFILSKQVLSQLLRFIKRLILCPFLLFLNIKSSLNSMSTLRIPHRYLRRPRRAWIPKRSKGLDTYLRGPLVSSLSNPTLGATLCPCDGPPKSLPIAADAICVSADFSFKARILRSLSTKRHRYGSSGVSWKALQVTRNQVLNAYVHLSPSVSHYSLSHPIHGSIFKAECPIIICGTMVVPSEAGLGIIFGSSNQTRHGIHQLASLSAVVHEIDAVFDIWRRCCSLIICTCKLLQTLTARCARIMEDRINAAAAESGRRILWMANQHLMSSLACTITESEDASAGITSTSPFTMTHKKAITNEVQVEYK